MAFKPSTWKHFAATAIIGDGVMALVHPQREAAAWEFGPASWQRLMQTMQRRPGLTRMVGIAQIVGGILWVLREERRDRLG